MGDPQRWELRESVGKHQVAIVDFPYRTSTIPDDRTKVIISWGFGSNQRTFYGYVNHHEDIISFEQVRMVRMYLLGTSLPMNGQNPQAWKGLTASYIAKRIAQSYGLRSIIHNSKFTIPYWTSASMSDWVMLGKLADKVGYNFWVDGSTLYFIDPSALLKTSASTLVNDLVMDMATTDTLTEFQNISGPLGVNSARSSKIQTVYGIDANTHRFIKSTSTKQTTDADLPLSSLTATYSKAVSSLSEARQANQSMVQRSVWSQAKAITTNISDVHIGSLVNVMGNWISDDNSGVWMVTGDTHVMEFDDFGLPHFSVELELTRNQKTDVSFSTITTIKDALASAPAVIRNNRWESSVLESVYV